VSNSRVVDVMGCITGKHNVYEQLKVLCKVTTKDNVNLKTQGYDEALARGLVREATTLLRENKRESKWEGSDCATPNGDVWSAALE
jgi:hypothetical protein